MNWGPFYTKVAQSIIDNQWHPGVNICDLASDGLRLSSFGPAVSNSVQSEALNVVAEIKAGKLTVFAGPVIDSTGKVRLAAGKKPDIKWLASMDFFVPGVDGTLPKK